MNSLHRTLSHPLFIAAVGITLIALLVWYAGPQLKFGADNSAPLASVGSRLSLILVMILLWMANAWRKQFVVSRNNKALVSDLKDINSLSTHDFAQDQAADEIAQLGDRFQSALETLNRLKFKGKGRKKALYQLPWYIIVGPPGAGKTTALVNSGLEFPLADEIGTGAVQGVGGTRNCDWWFTNDAVLIDTAGRYTTQDSHKVVDGSAWEGFLKLLKRNRPRRPINGALVAISLQDLLLQSDEERSQLARNIRTRLDELMDKLEIRFPVYVIFTKSDLVQGFSEFFEDLTKDDREQVWGISLPNAAKSHESPDFSYIKQHLHQLSSRLNERVLWRMHQERDPQRCAAIESFPLQMDNAFKIVESFVVKAFSQNRFHYQPYLRGVYFSSGTQDGTPIDRLMGSVSANFGFSREAQHRSAGKGKSYFLTNLLREVIFPESELVGSNRRYERYMRTSLMGIYLVAAVVTIATLALWTGSVTRNNLYMQDVKSQLNVYKSTTLDSHIMVDGSDEYLPSLNALLTASSVYNVDKHPWLSSMGLYDGRVDAHADQLYFEKLNKDFLPHIKLLIEKRIKNTSDNETLYSLLRLYMMLEHTDKLDKAQISQWISDTWKERFGDESSSYRELITHLDNLMNTDIRPQTLNLDLIAITRSKLAQIPLAKRIYSQIKNDTQYAQMIDLKTLWGSSVNDYFEFNGNSHSIKIPALFTLEGYKSLDLSQDSVWFKNVGDDSWVMGEALSITRNDSSQYKKISREVRELYLTDYATEWSNLLSSMKVKRFNSMTELAKGLTTSVDNAYSPILAVLDTVKANTQLTTELPDAVLDKVEQRRGGTQLVSLIRDRKDLTAVDKRFYDIHHLMEQPERGVAPVLTTLQQVDALRTFIQEIGLAPDVEQRAFDVVKTRYQSNTGNAITTLKAYARTTPEPLQGWLVSLSDEAWRILSQQAYSYVSKEWRSQVYQPYSQMIAGRYPLNANTTDELAILDFSSFFKPQGTLHKFTEDYVEPFIEKRGTWSSRGVDGVSLGMSASTLLQLQRASQIRETYFKHNPESPSMTVELRPQFMSKEDALFTLDLGEQRLTYSHGPKFWKTFTWTGDQSARLRIAFEDLHGSQFDKVYSGPWAWFRLLDSSTIEATSQSNVYYITFSDGNSDHQSSSKHRKITFEGRTNSVNNSFKNDLIRAFKCPETL
jgi:type VI secretion system protein ImpL